MKLVADPTLVPIKVDIIREQLNEAAEKASQVQKHARSFSALTGRAAWEWSVAFHH
jgi:chromosome condensin MukBEF ATPase and DNA-binding subunit MukB